MFRSNNKLQPEMNPIDLLRKYAPYLIVAGSGVGCMMALYYTTFSAADNSIVNASNDAARSLNEADKNTHTLLNKTEQQIRT